MFCVFKILQNVNVAFCTQPRWSFLHMSWGARPSATNMLTPTNIAGYNSLHKPYSETYMSHYSHQTNNVSSWGSVIIFSPTVGQRKKVTTVTFFPRGRGRIKEAQIRAKYAKFPWIKSRDLVYTMDETRSQFSANNGIIICLVREIW